MTFVVGFGAFADSSDVRSCECSVLAFAAARQEYLAGFLAKYLAWQRLVPNATVHRALDNCLGVLDHSLRRRRDVGRRI
jgi:hypothetical protein